MLLGEVKETINRYGGLQITSEPENFKYYSTDDQIQLFD